MNLFNDNLTAAQIEFANNTEIALKNLNELIKCTSDKETFDEIKQNMQALVNIINNSPYYANYMGIIKQIFDKIPKKYNIDTSFSNQF